MLGTVLNYVPNVFMERSYIQTAERFSKIFLQNVPSILLFPNIILIVDAAILKVPVTEALGFEIYVFKFMKSIIYIHIIKQFNEFQIENISASRNVEVS